MNNPWSKEIKKTGIKKGCVHPILTREFAWSFKIPKIVGKGVPTSGYANGKIDKKYGGKFYGFPLKMQLNFCYDM